MQTTKTQTQTAFETGDKVSWTVGKFTFFGLYKREKDSNTSLVQIYQRNFQKFCKGEMEVTSSLLRFLSPQEELTYISQL